MYTLKTFYNCGVLTLRGSEAGEHCGRRGEQQQQQRSKEAGDFEAAGPPDPPGHCHQPRHSLDQETNGSEEPVSSCPDGRRGNGEIFQSQNILAPGFQNILGPGFQNIF